MTTFHLHHPKQGEPVPISMMENGHLQNTILNIARRMGATRQSIEQASRVSEFDAAFSPGPNKQEAIEELQERVRALQQVLRLYVFETQFREGVNLEKISTAIKAAYGRTGAIPNPAKSSRVLSSSKGKASPIRTLVYDCIPKVKTREDRAALYTLPLPSRWFSLPCFDGLNIEPIEAGRLTWTGWIGKLLAMVTAVVMPPMVSI